MYNYLKLIRYQNILFIALILFVLRQLVVAALLDTYGIIVYTEQWHLWLLITATTLLSAGGYALNDYFDVKIDTLNKPDKVLVGRTIDRNKAMLVYQVCTVIGMIAGFALAWLIKSRTIAVIFIVVPGLIWFYSASYKRQYLIGNLVVAFLSSLSIILLAITENAYLMEFHSTKILETKATVMFFSWIAGFAVFSFLLTLIREIIKDIEDEYGDKEMECRTLPIVSGRKVALVVIFSLIVLIIALLLIANFYLVDFQGTLSIKYTVFGLILPLLALISLLIKAKRPVDFHQASTLTKFIMLIGLLYAVIFNFLLAQDTGILFLNLFNVH
ncbi:MAG: hypothetical protein BGO29_11900 [Bacteroidales bacterium 36-12]|nr:MAG: hypothetical protein BGO29_11900 [Bacteroidales bacterium 36-12]